MSSGEDLAASQAEYAEDPTENQRLCEAALPLGEKFFVLRIITGNDAGSVIELSESSYILGRGRRADLRIDCNRISRTHARLTRVGETVVLEDLASKNGTWVDGNRLCGAHELVEGQRIGIGDVVMRLSLLDKSELVSAHATADAARKDPITRCFNRSYFDQRLLAEVARAQREDRTISLLMLDLDHFKTINDRFGHAAGDATLRAVGQTLATATRFEDVVARYGGEEFAVLLPGTTPLGAALLAQRMRSAIAELTIEVDAHVLRATASLGVASLERGHRGSPEALVRAADDALYAAKHSGRNRVCIGHVDHAELEDTTLDALATVTEFPDS